MDDIRYDYVSKYARVPQAINTAELELDLNASGTATNAVERAYFLSNVGSCAGCWDNAAHELIDYVKVWDLPKDIHVASYPH